MPKETDALSAYASSAQSFSWQASLLAEKLVKEEGIDIIEAQEWEAPLYYFQLRRALRLGPELRAPCIIHLHSPTEMISRHNGRDLGRPTHLTAKRLEDYSIGAADAWLCPSQFLARQAETHYGMPVDSIRSIPYPLGEEPFVERSSEVWERGTVCYMGRLERRKGIIEWIQAALSIAQKYPDIKFEFIGGAMGGEDFIECKIPVDLQNRFVFHGVQSRNNLLTFLKKARMAVVPSRWENFPNVCMEAMASGLPVLATRESGMPEMITDGRSGWLVQQPHARGLADTLELALTTPPDQLAQMGAWASQDIRRLCDKNLVLERQLAFRDEVRNRGVCRSHLLPANLPWARKPLSDSSRRRASSSRPRGIALVVRATKHSGELQSCFRSIKRLTQKPELVVIVKDRAAVDVSLEELPKSWMVTESDTVEDKIACNNHGISAVMRHAPNCIGMSFLQGDEQLHPQFTEICEFILRLCPEVGLVSSWASHRYSYEEAGIRPCPSLPYQWLANDAASFSVLRTEALTEAGGFRPVMKLGYGNWDVFNAVLVAGWVGVTVPRILVEQGFREELALPLHNPRAHGRMREELLGRFPDVIAQDASHLVSFVPSGLLGPPRREAVFLDREIAHLRRIAASPYLTTRWALKKVARRIRSFMPQILSRA